jgi:hypothetical protein
MRKFFSFRARFPFIVFLGFALICLGFLFWHGPNQALYSVDASPAAFNGFHYTLTSGFVDWWCPSYSLGIGRSPISPGLNMLPLGLFSFPYSATLSYSLHILIAGIGMYVLLRSLRLESVSCIFGGLAFLLTNTVITLIFPGHVHKFMTCAWVPYSIAAFIVGLRDQRFGFFIVAGCFLGLSMLPGEVQICYYLGLWFTAWTFLHFFHLWRQHQLTIPVFTKLTLGLGVVALSALVLAIATTLFSLDFLQTNQPVVGAEDSAMNWHFATQFYFPPEEVLSYITTAGFFGAPDVYWGRNGLPDCQLRLSDDYMGLLPLGFAILGAIACWRIWQVRLFIVMGIFSLLASFGREGIVYYFLYQLPTMKAQRNPHRWSYFVSLAVCVLAAYGVHWLIEKLRTRPSIANTDSHSRSTLRRWEVVEWCLLGLTAIGFLIAILGVLSSPETLARMRHTQEAILSPSGQALLTQAQMMIQSLVRTGWFLVVSAGSLWLMLQFALKSNLSTNLRIYAPFALVVFIMVLDLSHNARRFLQFYPWKDMYYKNDLMNHLLKDTSHFRVRAFEVHQNNLVNQFVTFILPFHRIPVVEPPATSRLATDYAKFQEYTSRHYVPTNRYYDFFNIKYVLRPGPFSDPNMKFDLVAQWNNLFLYKRDDPMPRAWLIKSPYVVEEGDDAVLFQTMHPLFKFRESAVLVERPTLVPFVIDTWKTKLKNKSFEEVQRELPSKVSKESVNLQAKGKDNKKTVAAASQPITPPPHNAEKSEAGSVQILKYEDNRITLQTSAATPTMLVMSEKWDPNWKCWVDETPAKIYKANFLMRGVELPSGSHQIRFEYRPSTFTFWCSAGFVILFAVSGIGYVIFRFSRSKLDPA